MGRLFNFPGGIHLEEHKSVSNGTAVRKSGIPARLFVPLDQHIGPATECIVSKGEKVLKGQTIGSATEYISAPVHAPTSGTVIDIQKFPAAHASALPSDVVIIEPDGKDEWQTRTPLNNYRGIDPSELRNIVRGAGIVGLGGAAFPTFVKLNPVGHDIKALILNGAECEPWITCDDMLMRTRHGDIIEGARVMRLALQAARVIIAIEDNKPQAISALKPYADKHEWLTVQEIPTRYPTGGEKQLIRILTGQDVPSHGLPLDLDLVVQNVATAAAVHHAINEMQPLISRIITVTGPGVKSPCNIEALIGTPMSDLIDMAGGYTRDADRLIMGGPMMGITLKTDVTPVIKATNCLLVQTPDAKRDATTTRACIRCGECVKVCPMRLLPQQLYWYSRSRNFDQLQRHHLFDCIECGCCAEVCPSHIPLVQYYRFGKSEIWKKEQETLKADRARMRTEARLEREERIKAERKARHARAKAAKAAGSDSKQTEIKAAVARAKARKAEQKSATEDA